MKQSRTCCFIEDYTQNYFTKTADKNHNFIKQKTKLKEVIISLVEDFSVNHFISGMELGLEQFFAESILELKTKFPGIFLEGVIPYENQVINWTECQRDKYYSIMQKIDKEVLIQYHYSQDCMRNRNLYMINKSKYIILCTDNTSKIKSINTYARSIGKAVFVMDGEILNKIPNIRICR